MSRRRGPDRTETSRRGPVDALLPEASDIARGSRAREKLDAVDQNAKLEGDPNGQKEKYRGDRGACAPAEPPERTRVSGVQPDRADADRALTEGREAERRESQSGSRRHVHAARSLQKAPLAGRRTHVLSIASSLR